MEPVISFFLILPAALAASAILYLYLHHKTGIERKYLITDSPAVALLSALAAFLLVKPHNSGLWLLSGVILIMLVIFLAFAFTMIRFWRVPRRKASAGPGQIVSPADGRVIYVNRLTRGDIPEAVKGRLSSRLDELTKTTLLNDGGWHLGINMTPFDVHKNCAPVSGKVILNSHFRGKFLSLKNEASQCENERNTYVIVNEEAKVGVVQIASRLVRRIDSYVKEGDSVKQGDWIGMIRFGSQVDLIIPENYRVLVEKGQQIYAVRTIIAQKDEVAD